LDFPNLGEEAYTIYHAAKVAFRCKSHMLLAMIVGHDGQTSEKHFPDHYSAIQWLEGEGSASFKGKIERIELYNHREMLIWADAHQVGHRRMAKSDPKQSSSRIPI
jgi:hypothetical protein